VATTSLEGVNITGPVTLDPSGKLTGQFVDQMPNASGSPDKVVINAVSVPNTLGTNSGNLNAFVVGVVGGPAGGVQTGVGSTQMIRNITSGDGAGGIRLPRFEGTTVLTPAMGGAPPTLTTTLNGVLNVAPNNAIVKTTGAVATTPKP